MPDPNAQTRVEVEDHATIRLVLIDSSTGDDICSLRATATATDATVLEGQTCFGSEDSDQRAQIRSGKAHRTEQELTLELLLDAEADGDQGSPVQGTVEYHFVGSR
jgi:hypothetical protein